LRLEGKRILDMGCGRGATSIYAAQAGARSVVGVDVREEMISVARDFLATRFPELASRVELRRLNGTAGLGSERFDVILSKDVLEHVADPETHVRELREQLAEDGVLAIGFGPLWKSPYGGHIEFMTRLPWAHLLFPEEVVMTRRSLYVTGDDVRRYEDIRGGLNKMTLHRFVGIMDRSGLECTYFRTNLARSRVIILLRALSRVPALREYFTLNAYGVWRRPRVSSATYTCTGSWSSTFRR
jgi:SAM-dependent methyltransferase